MDSDSELSDSSIEEAAQLICRCGNLSVFTGAGISVESGIADFRSPGGLWSRQVRRNQFSQAILNFLIEFLFTDTIHHCTVILMFSRSVQSCSGAWPDH